MNAPERVNDDRQQVLDVIASSDSKPSWAIHSLAPQILDDLIDMPRDVLLRALGMTQIEPEPKDKATLWADFGSKP